jgi:hypothetical protein
MRNVSNTRIVENQNIHFMFNNLIVDNNKMDVQEVGGGRGDWMELAQDRDRCRALVSTVKNLRVP